MSDSNYHVNLKKTTLNFEKRWKLFSTVNCIFHLHKFLITMSLQKQFIKSKNVCKVTFTLPKEAANGAADVQLVGDFNNWDKKKAIPMKVKNGEYLTTLELDSGKEYQFRYLIGGDTWENDWAADKYVTTPFGIDNSVVVVQPEKG